MRLNQKLVNRHDDHERDDGYREKFHSDTAAPLNHIETDHVNHRVMQYVKRENRFVRTADEGIFDIQQPASEAQQAEYPAPAEQPPECFDGRPCGMVQGIKRTVIV